ncbi:hypothetical protein EC991_010282 [Linnemannia zychae]|nr:hypothetical protein EC991_010282 [Linnemannia zychae]
MALIPVCNNSKSHASQELKWLLQHAKQQSLLASQEHARSSSSPSVSAAGSLSEREIELMQGYVDERVKTRKPLQYILGTQPFMDLEILTRPPTLIPRWETEEWTARLATVLKSNPLIFRQHHQPSTSAAATPSSTAPKPLFNILDICTGSGCIPLGLASALPSRSSRLFGVDIHPKAVQLARDNALHNQALLNQNLVQFHQADLLAPKAVEQFLSWLEVEGLNSGDGANSLSRIGTGRYNLIISNPPYIAHSEYEELEPEVAQWEDPKALLADREGLVFYPRIAHMAMELLHRQPAPCSPSQSSSSAVQSASIDASETDDSRHHARELDPTTLERVDSLEQGVERQQHQHYHDSNNKSNSHRTPQQQQQDEEEAEAENEGIERTWRNGPDMDRVKFPELVFEIGGDHQVDSVTAAVRQAGFRRVQVWKDLADRARCIVGAR